VGGVSAARTISGANTGLSDPTGLTRNALGQLVVTNAGSHTITVYGNRAVGNAAAARTIRGIGSDTGTPGAVAILGEAPAAPSHLKVRRHNDTVRLSWTAATGLNGGGVAGYDIDEESNGLPDFGAILQGLIGSITSSGFGGTLDDGIGADTTKTTFVVHNLKAGQHYRFSVHAVNAFGSSAASNQVKIRTLAGASVPLDLTATRKHGSVTVRWKTPAKHGARPITSYDVEYGDCSSELGFCFGGAKRVPAKQHHLTLKHPHHEHGQKKIGFQVTAITAAGEGKASKIVKVAL
jgi:hypothetical protein